MNEQRIEFTPAGLVAAAIQTVRNPREAARAVLDEDLPVEVLWTMLAAVVAVSVVIGQGSLIALTDGPITSPYLANPLLMFGIQMALLSIMVFATHHIGRFMGGMGHFEGAVALVMWLQFVLVCLQVVQTGLMLFAPLLADLVGVAGLVLFLWLFTNFVSVLHGFRSLGLVFVMILLSAFGVTFLLSVVLTMLGVTVPGEFNV